MSTQKKLMTDWRWWICSLLFVATTVNYLDRQVLSLRNSSNRNSTGLTPITVQSPHSFPFFTPSHACSPESSWTGWELRKAT